MSAVQLLANFMIEATKCLARELARQSPQAASHGRSLPSSPLRPAPFSFGIVRHHRRHRLARSSHRGSQFNSIATDGAHSWPLSPPFRLKASEAGLLGINLEPNISKCCGQSQEPNARSSVVAVSCAAISTSLRIASHRQCLSPNATRPDLHLAQVILSLITYRKPIFRD